MIPNMHNIHFIDKIIIIIAIIIFCYYMINFFKNKEFFLSEMDNEALANIASLYNTKQLTVTNANIVGQLTSNKLSTNQLQINPSLILDASGNISGVNNISMAGNLIVSNNTDISGNINSKSGYINVGKTSPTLSASSNVFSNNSTQSLFLNGIDVRNYLIGVILFNEAVPRSFKSSMPYNKNKPNVFPVGSYTFCDLAENDLNDVIDLIQVNPGFKFTGYYGCSGKYDNRQTAPIIIAVPLGEQPINIYNGNGFTFVENALSSMTVELYNANTYVVQDGFGHDLTPSGVRPPNF